MIGQKLDDALSTHFVGRVHQLNQLNEWAQEAAHTPRVIWIWGPGGIGKSTLVRRFCTPPVQRTVWLDCESLPPNRLALDLALEAAIRDAHPDQAADATIAPMGSTARVDVLVVDALETAECGPDWLIKSVLPAAGPRLLVLVTSRARPTARLRSDLRWLPFLRELHLDGLAQEDVSAFLQSIGVEPSKADGLHAAIGGHPLSMVLATLADTSSGASTLETAIETAFGALSHIHLSPKQTTALEALALCRTLDEPLLDRLFDEPTEALWRWLSQLDFTTSTRGGLKLHGSVSAVLRTRLYGQPDRWGALCERVVHAWVERIWAPRTRAGCLTVRWPPKPAVCSPRSMPPVRARSSSSTSRSLRSRRSAFETSPTGSPRPETGSLRLSHRHLRRRSRAPSPPTK